MHYHIVFHGISMRPTHGFRHLDQNWSSLVPIYCACSPPLWLLSSQGRVDWCACTILSREAMHYHIVFHGISMQPTSIQTLSWELGRVYRISQDLSIAQLALSYSLTMVGNHLGWKQDSRLELNANEFVARETTVCYYPEMWLTPDVGSNTRDP